MRIWTYEFSITALNTLRFSDFSGPAFRGGFGNVLRGLTCVTGLPDCGTCPVIDDCAFTRLFNPQRPPDNAYFAKEQNVPRPFAISPPAVSEVKHGQKLKFRVVLFGRANQLIPYVVLSYRELGEKGIGAARGKYKLNEVAISDPLGAKLPIVVFDADTNQLFPTEENGLTLQQIVQSFGDKDISTIALDFVTPTHLKSIGKSREEPPSFEVIVRAILRRYSDLCHLYGDGRPALDYARLIEAARAVKLVRSDVRFVRQWGFSRRKGDVTPSEGLVGQVKYEGELRELLPYVVLGQYLQVGKQATFGMGKYELRLGPVRACVPVLAESTVLG